MEDPEPTQGLGEGSQIQGRVCVCVCVCVYELKTGPGERCEVNKVIKFILKITLNKSTNPNTTGTYFICFTMVLFPDSPAPVGTQTVGKNW